MEIRLIRNATIIVNYAGKRFLIDPVLAEKGSFRAFGTNLRPEIKNPIVELPVPIEELINVDAVIITHMHLDHFDPAAKEALPKDMKIFIQNEEDAKELRDAAFQDVELLGKNTIFDINLIKTPGQHGRGDVIGHVCGVVFKHPEEKTLYIAGDTVWYDGVQNALDSYQPEVIVVNGGGNVLMDEMLVMGENDIYEVHKASPDAKIVVVHMEAMNHWTLSRDELNSFIKEKGLSKVVLVPDDGQSYTL